MLAGCERLHANDMEAIVPLREGTSGYAEHDREKYKWRHLVENFFCSLKAFRRSATRYVKTAAITIVAVHPRNRNGPVMENFPMIVESAAISIMTTITGTVATPLITA